MTRRQKVHTPRLPRIPMMPALRDQFGMQMHTALLCLERAPGAEPFEALAEIFNVIQITLEHDTKRAHEARLITGGAAALVQIEHRVRQGMVPQPYEIAPIQIAVNTIDAILGQLNVDRKSVV